MNKKSKRPSRVMADACAVKPQTNIKESPLAWLARRTDKEGRPMLSDAEVSAGERLRADFWFAQLTPNVTMNWSNLLNEAGGGVRGPGHGIEMSERVVASRERVHSALKAVGPELSGMLFDVCCHLKGLESAERAGGWPQRSGKVVLQIALRMLARHYGFINDEGERHGSRAKPSHWGAADYRPTMGGGEAEAS